MSNMRIKRTSWRQIGGDMDPSQHGGTIARFEGDAVEIIQIQPVRYYIGGDDEAISGLDPFPFWSKTGWYDPEDLALESEGVQSAMSYIGLTVEDLPEEPDQRALCLAEACLSAGYLSDEGEGGWAKDVLGSRRVKWWGSKGFAGWRYLADEDQEFRALVRESEKEEK